MEMEVRKVVVGGREVVVDDLTRFLHAGANSCRCGIYLHNLDALQRQQMYHTLETERLMTKYERVCEMHDRSMDWNHIFLVGFMQWVSDKDNRDNYMEIAMHLSYGLVARERTSLRNLETLLLAVSGLLPTLPDDDFTREVRRDADYLIHKYQLRPLPTEQWRRKGIFKAKEPILRLSQIARVLYENKMPFNKLVSCRKRDDLRSFFGVEASAVWSRYFGGGVNHIGVDKCDILGINFVVPMLFAYGHYSSDDELVSVACELGEEIPAEVNGIIRRWRNHGLTPVSSYETQALLQLHKVYCKTDRCEECVVYKHLCSKASILDRVPIFLENMR